MAVWVLVGLFFYLNRYTQRRYFTIWAVAWLSYAVWLTLMLFQPPREFGAMYFALQQTAIAASAVFLFWGSVSCLNLKARDRMMVLFLGFVVIWSYVAHSYVDRALLIQLPIFGLTGTASVFVGCAFLKFRRKSRLVGAGLLFFGFIFWGVFLASFPFANEHRNLVSTAFLVSTGLQLFIAVSMIVLVLEEVRQHTTHLKEELDSTRHQQRSAQLKVLTAADASTLLSEKQLSEDLQQAYSELRRTHHAVVQQERLRALGQMASGIAHDINNALCPIVSFSELLLGHPAVTPDMSRKLRHIQTAGNDIARLVARMRDFYRRRSSRDELAPVNLGEVVQQVLDLTRPRWRDMAQRNGLTIAVETRIPADLPTFQSQESELREALTNLVLNAVDAMPSGGTITISAEVRPTDQQIAIDVVDTGTGMTEEVRKRCLEPFFSTKDQRGGSGLGLAMVYGIVQRHEGTIDVESELGRGTRVRLCLPFHPASGTAKVEAPVPAKAPALRILCVDDEPMLRQLLDQLLTENGFQVKVAADGAEGIAMFEQARGSANPFDVVITDLGMPIKDGVAVARHVRQATPKKPVVLLTGWGNALSEDVAPPSLFAAKLSKPLRVADLMSALTRVASVDTSSAVLAPA